MKDDLAWRLVRWLDLADRVPEGATLAFEWGQPPRGEAGLLGLLALLTLAALVLAVYRREGRVGRLRKAGLAALRLAAIAVVALVLLEPRLAVDLERTVEGHVVVLWDRSLSMSLADRYEDEARRAALARAAGLAVPEETAALTRHELAWRIVERAGLLPGLAARNRLLVYGFDREPVRVDGGAAQGPAGAGAPGGPGGPGDAGDGGAGPWAGGDAPAAPDDLAAALAPLGPATDLALAVRRALEDTGGRGLAAVVAVTDGRRTQGDGPRAVIEALEARRVPFYALGVGDPTPPRNLEVTELACERRALLGDPLEVEGAVRARGFAGTSLELELVARAPGGESGGAGGPGGDEEVLERRTVEAPADGQTVRARFTWTPQAVGERVLALRVPSRAEETVADDNERAVTVTITDDKSRVLLVAGSPTFEYHALKTALVRERTAVVSCWLMSADPRFPQDGNERVDALPASFEALRAFDAVLLLDPDPDGLDAGFAEALKRFATEHRGGVLFQAGPKFTAGLLARPDLRPLHDLLPVTTGGGVPEGRLGGEAWPLKATADGADHPASRLHGDPERSRWLWSRLPGPFVVFPVAREKAGATVLVRHDDPQTVSDRGGRPVLVVQFFEGGPVAWLGTGETWRWRGLAPRVLDRFWVGALRFLIQGRLTGGRARVEVLTDKEQYVLGEPVRVRVHALDRGFKPWAAPGLEVVVKTGGEEARLELAPSPRGQPGWYEGTVLPAGQGAVEVAVRLPDADPGEPPVVATALVRASDLELAEPMLDEALLASIAEATSGALVAPGDLGGLAERIPSLTQRLVVAGAPILLWDRWATVLLVVGLLAAEWAWRKRSRLV